MKKINYLTLLVLVTVGLSTKVTAQYQPPGNYGLTNILDGAPPMPGTYYMGYLSYYSGTMKDDNGDTVKPNGSDPLKVNSALFLNQLVHITNVKVLGGNLLFDALVPVVSLNENKYDLVGKSGLGDITLGVGVQWFNKKLFGLPYHHRLELDYILPTGSSDDKGGTKPINAGSQFATFQPYYAQSLFFNKDISLSLRHHLSFNGLYKGTLPPNTKLRVGSYYHVNYSLESIIGKGRFNPGQSGELRAAIQGYYGTQLSDDQMNGTDINSKESVFAVGPGLHYITKKGLALELKAAFEVAAQNRTQGERITFRLVKLFPFKSKK